MSINGGTVQLGANGIAMDQFANVNLNAGAGVIGTANGSVTVQGALEITAPVITGAAGSNETISAVGALRIVAPDTVPATTVTGGLGASLTLAGATVSVAGSIVLPSGQLTLHATNGDLLIGGANVSTTLDVSGRAQTFYDVIKYSGGGAVTLAADAGNINLAAGSTINVSAPAAAGNAGSLTLFDPAGTFTCNGALLGSAGVAGSGATFTLDTNSLAETRTLDALLNAGGFNLSRSIRIRTGDVLIDGAAQSQTYNLSADTGSITVAGTLDDSGATGGSITLEAHGSLVLLGGSLLSVAGKSFDSAGKGGAVTLEAGGETNGIIDPGAMLDIQKGSKIDLSVAANTAESAGLGDFTGTLHLRAPQTAGGTDARFNPINGTILNASKIVVEGYKLLDITGNGLIDGQESNVFANGQKLAGNAAGITNRLLAQNAGLSSVLVVVPGAEIINRTGDLTLSGDWDLSGYRFGPDQAPGILTLRAAGNLVLQGALSDGFTSSAYDATLLACNPLLPVNAQSWSYRLAAGSDFSAADFRCVQPVTTLDSGSVKLGVLAAGGINESYYGGDSADLQSAIAGYFQVIRTGAGDIEIAAQKDLQLLNQFASIYTVGTQTAPMANFDVPQLYTDSNVITQYYSAQYSMAGGNITISAQGNILHLARNNSNVMIEDSVRELPTNWLYRRGYVDSTGHFGQSILSGAGYLGSTEVASTTWWVDFSNFFEGVGALGGGNVTLKAGQDIRNVDAVIPTNARMTGYDSSGNPLAPDSKNLLELGGGNLTVIAGHNISGGVYYVERGAGTITAGNSIITNATRAPFATNFYGDSLAFPSSTWLPTTLYLGKGSFTVSARYDLLLGPVVNPFLLPAGIGNSYFEKTYFSTYASTDSVEAVSLAGNVTLRESVVSPIEGNSAPVPILQEWMQYVSYYDSVTETASFYQPWLRLNETLLTPFSTAFALMPSTVEAVSYLGNINLVGSFSLTPSANGTLELLAGGAVNGLQVVGSAGGRQLWGTATINLSDANPDSIPGILSPYDYQNIVGQNPDNSTTTQQGFLAVIDDLFAETGATSGAASVLQTKQALHSPGLLHAADTVPAMIYAACGNISGLTFYSSKTARVISSQDITDIALYIQNTSSENVSMVSAGRDLIAYDPNSALRSTASSIAAGNSLVPSSASSLAGDIQISGPGTLEVLTGRNLELGVGPTNSNGTALGIVSIGNERNPYLPFDGADVIACAGLGSNFGLANSHIDFTAFVAKFLDPSTTDGLSARFLPDLGVLLGLDGATDGQVWTAFENLAPEKRDMVALDIFYLALRDAGRDHNNPDSTGFRNYNNGFAAITALFPGATWQGDVNVTSREIKTVNGGNIDILTPGGSLTVGLQVANQPIDQGILTQHGGNISIFTNGNVGLGTSRIFTLRGGSEIIWSSAGNIAAGSASKTIQSAPPTRVLVDPQSADITTDLSGLATGGGIGVLATVTGVAPGDVDLIAPTGTIDAGDAGIRTTGNFNAAANQILNAGNIQAGGVSTGTPQTSISAPGMGGLASTTNSQAASSGSADQAARQGRGDGSNQEQIPSVISVEVLGYGGGDDGDDEEQLRRKKKQTESAPLNVTEEHQPAQPGITSR